MSTAINQRVLVIAPQWVGDAIMSLPLIKQLKQEGHAIDVLATPAVEAVFQCCPEIDRRLIVPFAHGKLQWALRRQTASELRGKYGKAIVLPNSLKSALIPWLAGIPVRRGATGESRYWLINDRRDVLHDNEQARGRPSMLDQYLALADQPLRRDCIDRFDRHRPEMRLPPDAGWGDHGLDAQALGGWQNRKLLALCPGAEYGPAKQWPADHFASAARAWLARSSEHGVLIIGSAKDIEISNSIMALMDDPGRIISLAGKTSLLEAFHWISICSMALSNDSGLMHAAAALGVPVVGIFGSSDPGHTPPHAKHARTLWLGLSCSPCFQRSCPLGTTACLKDLSAQMAMDAISALAADAQAAHAVTPRASQ